MLFYRVVALLVLLSATSAHASPCHFHRFKHVKKPPDTPAVPWCHKQGFCYSCPSYDPADACPYQVEIFRESFDCATGSKVGESPVTGDLCPCDPNYADQIASRPDGGLDPSYYQCDLGPTICSGGPSGPGPDSCTGEDADLEPPFNEGCGDDEHGCGGAADGDGAPTRFTSGRVETKPLTLVSLPTPDGIDFEYRIQWGSHVDWNPARARLVNGIQDLVPTTHDHEEVTHFIGRGWHDNYSDRLVISSRTKPSTIINWISMNGTVTFSASSGWKSWSGKYEIVDRGPTPADGLGRWVVRTTDPHAPRKIWSFEETSYTSYGGVVYKIGRLKRRALLTSNLNNLAGRYGYSVQWSPDGIIDRVVDSLGRELVFTYYSPAPVNGVVHYRHLSMISVRPTASASLDPSVMFQMDSSMNLLDRVTRSGVAGYTRYVYGNQPANCSNCGTLLTDVLIPRGEGNASPAIQAPPLSSEIGIEHNEYSTGVIGLLGYQRPLGTYSRYPGREYGYEHRATRTTQFDLHQDGGPCSQDSTCQNGHACRAADNRCYVAKIFEYQAQTRQSTNVGYSSGGGGGGGAINSAAVLGTFQRSFTTTGAPKSAMEPGEVRTSFGFDTFGRIRCIVRNDDDDEAFSTPSQPDTSSCEGPSSAQIIQVDYEPSSIAKRTASLLGGPGAEAVETTTLDGTLVLPTTISRTGWTRTINGTTTSEIQVTSLSYDSLGRVVSRNGPLPDATSLDLVTTTYYGDGDPSLSSHPYNLGHVKSVSQYVGSSSSNIQLTTTYAEYDSFGVPHLVTEPNGNAISFSSSLDRLVWTIQESSPGKTTTVSLNADGTTRSIVDADGVCTTYDYSDGSGLYVGAPTKIRRSSANDGCGILPINENSGEVEIRTYMHGERDRLETVTRKLSGYTHDTYNGFSYDIYRRLVSLTALDSSSPFVFEYEDVLLSHLIEPDAPGSGTARTGFTADAMGRPATASRFLDAINKQTYTFGYGSTFSPRPTQVARGYNGAPGVVTTFVYDDFARLVESQVPEVGAPGAPMPTRFEYDVGDRMIKRRDGVGSPDARTSAYTYDSIGRRLYVDHDTEHPVDCASAPAGTAIQDEEYRYDTCPKSDQPGLFRCDNALGRLSSARAIVQCGTAGQVVKRGRWYSYDAGGRVTAVAYATVAGSTIGAPAISELTYTDAGRLVEYTSPVNAAFGTRYALSSSSGEVVAVTTSSSPGNTIADEIEYRAFGPLSAMSTSVESPSGNGNRRLLMGAAFRSNNSLLSLDWSLRSTTPPLLSPIAVLKQTYTYTPAGLLQTRTDVADDLATRYYGYDALYRMTCEARWYHGMPSAVDCATPTKRTASIFTYGNGESATSPADARTSSQIFTEACDGNSPCYESSSIEQFVYSSGSSQVQTVNRTGNSLVIAHDTMGRRIYEYDDFDPVRSRRDYTYLPNGQLGMISGQTRDGTPYSVAIRYDERGRPHTISAWDNYELFWDESDRLIAVQITPEAVAGRPDSIRWHYHYLGTRLLAATREITRSGATATNRFWAVTDERGLLHRLVDQQGATYWQARWDATGISRTVGQAQGEMWVPFGLPGQIVLGSTAVLTDLGSSIQPGTEAFAEGVDASWTRPPIALNRWRAYDPLLGAFLAPDPLDAQGRPNPEGYAYARHAFPFRFDPTGLISTMFCDEKQIKDAATSAIDQINKCILGACTGFPGSEGFRRSWVSVISNSMFLCVSSDTPWLSWAFGVAQVDRDGRVWTYKESVLIDSGGLGRAVGILDWMIIGDPNAPRPILTGGSRCLAQFIAHEALHRSLQLTTMRQLFGGGEDAYIDQILKRLVGNDEWYVSKQSKCVECL